MAERIISRINSRYILEKAGYWSLLLTIFLISFPRSWSLYPLSIFMTAGLVLWLADCKGNLKVFYKYWFLIFPPVIYFLVHLISSIIYGSPIFFLEYRLMFLIVPILGFPVFVSDYLKSRLSNIFSVFIFGIVSISIFLIIRFLYLIFHNYPGGIPFYFWLWERQQEYFTVGFSILEHPTYLALKLNWVLILLIFYPKNEKGLMKYSTIILIFISAILFLVASKSGLFLWFVLVLVFLIQKTKRISNSILILIIPLFIFFAVISLKEIQRVEKFITTLKTDIINNNINWKNFDQRTRGWYSAIQLIKVKPFFGYGLENVETEMVQQYNKYGWKDEAELKLNAHNQYLEAQITFGIAGSISLIWMVLTPLIFRKYLKYKLLALFFSLVMSFSLVFESMFNRQWGIMFFILFYCILVTQSIPKNNIINHHID